eukprot:s2448_g3.t1
MLLLEFSASKGWLHEVIADLRWLSRFAELPFSLPTFAAEWSDIWPVLASDSTWKARVARACAKHVLEEKVAWEVAYYHDHIKQEFRDFGIVIFGDSAPPPDVTPSFACSHCPARFPTNQQLALHCSKLHGYVTPERQYIQSTVCPGCLVNFHTSIRVLQHLRYRANGCWDRIEGARLPDIPINAMSNAFLLFAGTADLCVQQVSRDFVFSFVPKFPVCAKKAPMILFGGTLQQRILLFCSFVQPLLKDYASG